MHDLRHKLWTLLPVSNPNLLRCRNPEGAKELRRRDMYGSHLSSCWFGNREDEEQNNLVAPNARETHTARVLAVFDSFQSASASLALVIFW